MLASWPSCLPWSQALCSALFTHCLANSSAASKGWANFCAHFPIASVFRGKATCCPRAHQLVPHPEEMCVCVWGGGGWDSSGGCQHEAENAIGIFRQLLQDGQDKRCSPLLPVLAQPRQSRPGQRTQQRHRCRQVFHQAQLTAANI